MKLKSKIYLIGFGVAMLSCNVASEADYNAMADDMCGCFNEATKGVSPEFKNAIIKADKENKDLEVIMTEMAETNPEQLLKDAAAFEKATANFEECGTKLEKKYDAVYTTESESEIQSHIVKVLQKRAGCELTVALVNMGLKAEGQE